MIDVGNDGKVTNFSKVHVGSIECEYLKSFSS